MMKTISPTFLVFLSLLCLAWGWEPGTQYVYKYVGRSTAGIHKLKQQNAVVELESIVTVQSIDDSTLVVQLTGSHVRRNGNFLGNALDGTQEIDGKEDEIPDSEILGTPFAISHNEGSINGVQIGADEPLWIVNIKKSVAGQLQLDITGVRGDGASYKTATKDGDKSTFSVFEDSVTGDCKTSIEINRLPKSQIYSSNAFDLKSFADVCKSKPVYQIVKTKDFDNCKSNPAWHTTTSNVYTCDFDKANCGDFLKRTSVTKYVACGESLSKLTIVYASGYSNLLAQPFATKTDELVNAVITKWTLENKESIGSPIVVPATAKEHKSLAYVFGDFAQLNPDGTVAQPNLDGASIKSPISVGILHHSILDSLKTVAADLKENDEAEQDNMDRLAVIARILPMFSLDELRYLWEDVRNNDAVTVTLFVDCVVTAGSNPAVLLIKELIETQQITGHSANFAMSALGYYVKTPTKELFHELLNLLKSRAVKSSKTLTQIGMMTVADLLNSACSSRLSAAKKYPVSVMGDFCESKSTMISNEFLPQLINELESSTEVFDRIVALTAMGSLGVEEVVPVLLPIIRGNGKFDDTAERIRSILSLQRVVFTAPEKIHAILTSLAGNVGERAEVRMASLGLLLMSNAPLSVWQKVAASTWFEPSRQVGSFTYTLIHSLSKAASSTPLLQELVQKATVALPLAKPAPFGLPFSFNDIQSSHLDEGITVIMQTINIRDSDQQFPAYLSNSYYYQLGPLNREPFTVTLWNFNMADVWMNIFGKIYGKVNPKYAAAWSERKGEKKENSLKGIWDSLRATSRPADKTAGLLHIDLLGGSVNRFINFADLEESIPKFMAEAMNNKDKSKPLEISITKYRMLAEYNIRFATELGLPMRYLFTLPMLISMQGNWKSDGKGGMDSDLAVEVSWKLGAEIRVDIPFNGNYIATGVDVLIESHAPRKMNFFYTPANLKVSYMNSEKVTDLLYYHVKPYTVSRSFIKPKVEGQELHVISVTDKPINREISVGGHFIGVNVKIIEHSEVANSDNFSWNKWVSKWDVNSWSNMGFVPSELNSRKYVVRYDPSSGTTSKTLSATFLFQYAAKSSTNNLVYESGSNQSRTPSKPELISYSPIRSEFSSLVETMFQDIENGNARLMKATITSEHQDGSLDNVVSTVGMAMNTRYTQDLTDWQVEHSRTSPSGNKKMNFALCYKAVRKWNNPPIYGFSKDVLEMTEEDDIGFGPECEHKVKFTAKLSRDESAAQAAIDSSSGQQCLKDMASGLPGSPACTAARKLDHIYNNYELLSQTDNMSDSWLQWARGHTFGMNRLLERFIVEHKQPQTNTPGVASWTIKRDPHTGDSDMIFIRPHETVVAKSVRWDVMQEFKRVSPFYYALNKVFYPLNAGSNYIQDTLELISGGVSEAKCYVGSNSVHTFDGASYTYTVDGNSHVLMTDCTRKSEIAILARQGDQGQKLITVHLGKDTIEMDPTSYVSVNGAKTDFTKMETGSFIEIRTPGSKSIKMVIFPMPEGGLIFDIRSIQFWMKIKGDYVELSAPIHMRGRACGLCGDFNQEITGEFKSADRCALSSGELMAASFKLNTSDGAASSETCDSVDEQFSTVLPDYAVEMSSYGSLNVKRQENCETYQLFF